MLKSVAIFLSVILMSQGLFVGFLELERMDALVEHAKFHQEQYGDDMAVFFDKHYGDLKDEHFEEHQEERSDHEQLPYHIGALFVNQAVYYFDQPETIYMIFMYKKNEQEDLTSEQVKILKEVVKESLS